VEVALRGMKAEGDGVKTGGVISGGRIRPIGGRNVAYKDGDSTSCPPILIAAAPTI
jgi:hypothetical protein